jgi:hypothetical protein
VGVFKIAQGMVNVVNSLDKGSCRQQTYRRPRRALSPEVRAAQAQAHSDILSEACAFAKRRRGSALTGVRSCAKLLKKIDTEIYSESGARPAQRELLRPFDVDEPTDERCVDMLACLPPEDAAFYEVEANVVELAGKSQILFEEIEERHCFVGGAASTTTPPTSRGPTCPEEPRLCGGSYSCKTCEPTPG